MPRHGPLHVLVVGRSSLRALRSDDQMLVAFAGNADETTELLRSEDYAVLVADVEALGRETLPTLHWAHHLEPPPIVILVHRSQEDLPAELSRHDLVFAVLKEPACADVVRDAVRAAARVARMNRALSAFARATTRLDAANS